MTTFREFFHQNYFTLHIFQLVFVAYDSSLKQGLPWCWQDGFHLFPFPSASVSQTSVNKTDCWSPPLGWCLRICIANIFPGDDGLTLLVQGPRLKEPQILASTQYAHSTLRKIIPHSELIIVSRHALHCSVYGLELGNRICSNKLCYSLAYSKAFLL